MLLLQLTRLNAYQFHGQNASEIHVLRKRYSMTTAFVEPARLLKRNNTQLASDLKTARRYGNKGSPVVFRSQNNLNGILGGDMTLAGHKVHPRADGVSARFENATRSGKAAALGSRFKLWSALCLALSINGMLVGNATAQNQYPTKAITIVSPFSAGGGTDFLARLLASELAKGIGQSVVVENRPGANGMIGSDYVAKARADGYTLLLGTVGTHGINQAVYDNVPYDTVKDFTPISLIARTPMLVLANPAVKSNNAKDLVNEARQHADPMIFSSAGVGSVGHVAGELFAQEAGIKLLHAPYKGAAPAAVDLVGGQVPLMFGTPVSTAQYVSSGKVKILGVTSAHRSKLVPDVPTLNEQGFKNFDVSTWYGLLAPANTPPEIVRLLAQKTKVFLADPHIQQQLLQQGLETVGNSPEEFTEQIRSEVNKWANVSIPK